MLLNLRYILVPDVPTPGEVVQRMFELGRTDMTQIDVVHDLGAETDPL
jgi:hypothetical protein